MADKHYRSIIKAISWRVTGTVDTIVVSYFVTGHVTRQEIALMMLR